MSKVLKNFRFKKSFCRDLADLARITGKTQTEVLEQAFYRTKSSILSDSSSFTAKKPQLYKRKGLEEKKALEKIG